MKDPKLVLSIEQMLKLKEIRILTQPYGKCLLYRKSDLGNYELVYDVPMYNGSEIKAFTLQDIINYLPKKISPFNDPCPYRLEVSAYAGVIDYTWHIYTFKKIEYDHENDENGILDAAYEMLKFLYENKNKWKKYL